MKWVSGDFVDLAHKHKATGIAFTANAVIMKKDDQYKLVMGAGAAKRIRDKFLGIDAKLAEEIVKNVNDYPEHTRQVKDYYLSYCDYDNLRIFAVQTKKHFKEAGDWDLTVQSLEQLANYIKHNPESKIILNCPLINNGGFGDRIDEVKQMVENIFKDTKILVSIL